MRSFFIGFDALMPIPVTGTIMPINNKVQSSRARPSVRQPTQFDLFDPEITVQCYPCWSIISAMMMMILQGY
jgi:hypothetical protein